VENHRVGSLRCRASLDASSFLGLCIGSTFRPRSFPQQVVGFTWPSPLRPAPGIAGVAGRGFTTRGQRGKKRGRRRSTVAGKEEGSGDLGRWCEAAGLVPIHIQALPAGRSGDSQGKGVRVVSCYTRAGAARRRNCSHTWRQRSRSRILLSVRIRTTSGSSTHWSCWRHSSRCSRRSRNQRTFVSRWLMAYPLHSSP